MIKSDHPHSRRSLDPDWITDPSQFYRRGWHASIAFDGFIYIDGGDVYHVENGTVHTQAANSTYSLSISESWTPSTVQVKRIDKGQSPPYNRESIWPSTDGKSIYVCNGDLSDTIYLTSANQPTSNQLWEFTPDVSGSGTWNLLSVANTLIQSSAAATTVVNGSAYILGGYQDYRSSKAIPFLHTYSADGLVTYNMASQTWENRTMTPFAPSGWSQEAQLEALTGIADGQLLLAMGGLTSSPSADQTNRVEVPYDVVSIYDTQAREWYNQTTTGDIPQGRGSACHVGIRGDNGTYEIFLHGGGRSAAPTIQTQQNIDLDQVYVLSIPSFRWHKSSYTPSDARATHTCQVAGRRQMIAFGGIPPSISNQNYTIDPWPQGIGIFDLTDMVWKDSYDARASPYSTPQLIKDDIAANGTYPSRWDSKVLENLIVGQNGTGSNTTSSTPSSSSKSSHTGAIAGGVVGGIALLALIALAAWFLLRRNKRHKPISNPRTDHPTDLKPELDANSTYRPVPQEMDTTRYGNAKNIKYGRDAQEMP